MAGSSDIRAGGAFVEITAKANIAGEIAKVKAQLAEIYAGGNPVGNKQVAALKQQLKALTTSADVFKPKVDPSAANAALQSIQKNAKDLKQIARLTQLFDKAFAGIAAGAAGANQAITLFQANAKGDSQGVIDAAHGMVASFESLPFGIGGGVKAAEELDKALSKLTGISIGFGGLAEAEEGLKQAEALSAALVNRLKEAKKAKDELNAAQFGASQSGFAVAAFNAGKDEMARIDIESQARIEAINHEHDLKMEKLNAEANAYAASPEGKAALNSSDKQIKQVALNTLADLRAKVQPQANAYVEDTANKLAAERDKASIAVKDLAKATADMMKGLKNALVSEGLEGAPAEVEAAILALNERLKAIREAAEKAGNNADRAPFAAAEKGAKDAAEAKARQITAAIETEIRGIDLAGPAAEIAKTQDAIAALRDKWESLAPADKDRLSPAFKLQEALGQAKLKKLQEELTRADEILTSELRHGVNQTHFTGIQKAMDEIAYSAEQELKKVNDSIKANGIKGPQADALRADVANRAAGQRAEVERQADLKSRDLAEEALEAGLHGAAENARKFGYEMLKKAETLAREDAGDPARFAKDQASLELERKNKIKALSDDLDKQQRDLQKSLGSQGGKGSFNLEALGLENSSRVADQTLVAAQKTATEITEARKTLDEIKRNGGLTFGQ